MPYKDPDKRKAKGKEYSKKHYDANKPEYTARNKITKTTNKLRFQEYKATLSCTHCGESHYATLDFHHHTPHPDNVKITDLIGDGRYAFAMKEIVEKCIVLCSNCHRKHHHNERQQKKHILSA